MQYTIKHVQGRKYLARFSFSSESPPPPLCFAFAVSSPHSFTGPVKQWSLQVTCSWVRPAHVAQCPDFPLWLCIKENTKPDEDNQVASAEHAPLTLVLTIRRHRAVTHAFPPASSHMFEPGFLTHELGPDTTAKPCAVLLLVVFSFTCRSRGAAFFTVDVAG